MDIIKGEPQIVLDDNGSSAFLDINFLPLDEKDRKLISE